MPDLFGFQAGRRQANMDDAALRQAGLDARATELGIKQNEQALRTNQALLDALGSGQVQEKASSPQEVPDVLEGMGATALATGNFELGRELLTAGSNIENQQSLIARREALTRYENLQTLSNLYNGVKDQAGWDRANSTFQLMTGEESPFAAEPYSPEMVEGARIATVESKDQAAVDLSKAREALVNEQGNTERRRQALLQAQEEYTERRAAAVGKAGGTPVPREYITAVADRLSDEFEDIGDIPKQLNSIATPYAEQVWALVRDNGLSLSQALDQVVTTAVDSGELAGWSPNDGYPSGSEDNPLELPLDKKGGVDAESLRPNKAYKYPGGKTLYVDRKGKMFILEPGERFDEANFGVGDEGE